MIRLVLYLLASLSLIAPAGASDAGNPRDVAEAYLAADERQDYEAMRVIYADDARFIDPTSFAIPLVTPPINWLGADAIIAGISSWGVDRLSYEIDRSYEASNAVIFDGSTIVTYVSELGERQFNYPIITIITVQDGKVVEHRDYTDFAGALELPAPPSPQSGRDE